MKTIYIDAALTNLQDASMLPSKKEKDSENGVRCMQISPCGKVLATGDRNGNLRYCTVAKCLQYLFIFNIVDFGWVIQWVIDFAINV